MGESWEGAFKKLQGWGILYNRGREKSVGDLGVYCSRLHAIVREERARCRLERGADGFKGSDGFRGLGVVGRFRGSGAVV